jgi:hypothetical protein
VHTHAISTAPSSATSQSNATRTKLTEAERALIQSVIERAEATKEREERRIGYVEVSRLAVCVEACISLAESSLNVLKHCAVVLWAMVLRSACYAPLTSVCYRRALTAQCVKSAARYDEAK